MHLANPLETGARVARRVTDVIGSAQSATDSEKWEKYDPPTTLPSRGRLGLPLALL
jgi:hypothetical protein